ncbi:MAG: CocE/NonD family hydrolase [Flavobacteriales bacterium]|nr:CocE/NonD family hydrolase [Flavobacteriales bacterium]
MRYLLLSLLLIPFLSEAQPLQPQEVQIPMRDSESLAADVYVPSGCSSCPTILIQTPYWKNWFRYNLPLDVGTDINNSPYAFVVVDWRGFYGSAGALNGQPNRGEDGYDCVEWIASQTWSNGKVGTWGPSALGVVQFQTAKEHPPHLTCCVPVVAAPQFDYLTYYPGGAYRTEYVEQLDALGYGLSTILQANPYYNLTWQFAENGAWYPEEMDVPFFMIGGWFDHNVRDMWNIFPAMVQNEPTNVDHRMLFGPWTHGGHGSAAPGTAQQGDLNFPAAEGWETEKAVAFFAYHLLEQQNGWQNEPRIRYFQMGRDEWLEASEWPPISQTVNYYLGSSSDISTTLGASGTSQYSSDPTDPSPTIGGPTLRADLLQGPYDISGTVEARSDYALFETEALTDDLSIQGRINVKLFVSTDQLDGDVAVRLTDVFPNNQSVLMRDGIQRLRFRNGYSQSDEVFCSSGQVYEVNIELDDIAHTFLTGHKIRLLISGANYPRFDVNLNNGQQMYTSGDSIVSTSSVHFGTNNPSRLELPVVMNVSVGNIDDEPNDLNIYPNPATDVVWVEMERAQNANLRLINTLGETVGQFNVQGSRLKFDVSGLKQGIYLLEVEIPNGVTNVSRFVKL